MSRAIVQNLKFRKATGLDPAALSEFMEEQYLKSNRTKFTQKQTFSPSTIGYGHGTCARYWYMAFTGAEFVDKNDALGIANMSNGSSVHERLQKLFRESGILVDEEVEVKLSDPPVRGFIDIMIRWNGEVVPGEIKSARQEAFIYRQTTMKPSANHLIQLLIYLKATGKPEGFLYYENKNSQEFLVIPVQMNEKNEALLEDVFNWMREVYRNYESGGLPIRPFRKNNKICKACPLFEECWNGEPGTVDISPMEVPKI